MKGKKETRETEMEEGDGGKDKRKKKRRKEGRKEGRIILKS